VRHFRIIIVSFFDTSRNLFEFFLAVNNLRMMPMWAPPCA